MAVITSPLQVMALVEEGHGKKQVNGPVRQKDRGYKGPRQVENQGRNETRETNLEFSPLDSRQEVNLIHYR